MHTLRLEIPEGAGTVHVDGAEVRVSGTTATDEFPAPIKVRKGDKLTVRLMY